MKKLSFPTVKLGNFICEVKEKVKNSGISQDDFTVYGVTTQMVLLLQITKQVMIWAIIPF